MHDNRIAVRDKYLPGPVPFHDLATAYALGGTNNWLSAEVHIGSIAEDQTSALPTPVRAPVEKTCIARPGTKRPGCVGVRKNYGVTLVRRSVTISTCSVFPVHLKVS